MIIETDAQTAGVSVCIDQQWLYGRQGVSSLSSQQSNLSDLNDRDRPNLRPRVQAIVYTYPYRDQPDRQSKSNRRSQNCQTAGPLAADACVAMSASLLVTWTCSSSLCIGKSTSAACCSKSTAAD
jgi:hypothetical protein